MHVKVNVSPSTGLLLSADIVGVAGLSADGQIVSLVNETKEKTTVHYLRLEPTK